MRKALTIGAAALAISFGVVACGSSDDSGDSSSDETLTKTELIAQADELCSKFDQEVLDSLNESGLNNQSSRADVAAYVSDTIVPLYRDQIEELRALTPPEEDAEAYNNIVDTLETELDAVEENPESAVTDDSAFEGATAAAKEFGLETCGSQS